MVYGCGDPTAEPGWLADVEPFAEVTVTIRVCHLPPSSRCWMLLEDNGIQPEPACRSGSAACVGCACALARCTPRPQAKLRMSNARSGWTQSGVAYPMTDVALDF